MAKRREKLYIIVATKDRPEDIRRLFACLEAQSVKPTGIVVVDGGVRSVEAIVRGYPGLNVSYLRKIPASLTVQRNAGVVLVENDATLIGFLDDDVILDNDAIHNMMNFWETASPDTGGAAFNITNLPRTFSVSLLERFFFVSSDKPYSILRSGFQTKPVYADRTMRVDWLLGCAMVWRREVFKDSMFDEWYKGLARCEEVDFSYRVGHKFAMYVVHDALIQHPLDRLEPVTDSFALGRMQILNRLYFVRKNPGLNLAQCLWGQFGLMLNNAIKGLLRFDRRYLLRACGNLSGFSSALLGHYG